MGCMELDKKNPKIGCMESKKKLNKLSVWNGNLNLALECMVLEIFTIEQWMYGISKKNWDGMYGIKKKKKNSRNWMYEMGI